MTKPRLLTDRSNMCYIALQVRAQENRTMPHPKEFNPDDALEQDDASLLAQGL